MNRKYALHAVRLVEQYGMLAESFCRGHVPFPNVSLPLQAVPLTDCSKWGLDYGVWGIYRRHLERLANGVAAQGSFALQSEFEETLAFVPDARRHFVSNAHLDSVSIGASLAPRIMAIDEMGGIFVAPFSDCGRRWSAELHALARRLLRLRGTFEAALPPRERRKYGVWD